MGTETTKTDFYRLTFGDVIALKGEQPEEFILDQGTRTELSDGNKSYFILLHGIKVNRKIYQPTEIEAELDFMENVVDPTNQEQTAAPQFDDVRQLLLQREVTLDFVGDNATLNIAKNCYVYELIPQLYRDTYGMKMYVKLSIFSMDKLMTLNKYSKAYVARKLGLEILLPESLNFGTISEGVPLIESYVGNLQHLTYTEDGKKLEFIQPIWFNIMSRSTTSWCAPPIVAESSSSSRMANWCWVCQKAKKVARQMVNLTTNQTVPQF